MFCNKTCRLVYFLITEQIERSFSTYIMSNFITNSEKSISLKQRLKELIKSGSELKILVGFFYFSGWKELYQELIKNERINIKVLVGLSVGNVAGKLIEYEQDLKNASREEVLSLYTNSLITAFNSEELDNRAIYEQYEFFIDLIKKGRLAIRKTYEPNHSKLYLFQLEDQVIKNLFITGSSNLTKAGLESQSEFNVEIRDYGFDEATKYFDDLWNNSVPITEEDALKNHLIQTIKQETLFRQIQPLEAYMHILKTYIDSVKMCYVSETLPEIMSENGYKIYQYQQDAIAQALSIIQEHNGVIIADVVGLGKTIIACSVAFEMRKRGIVIAPPSLLGSKECTEGWNKYLEEFVLSRMGWKAFSCGELENVQNFLEKAKDVEVVIIDEAHRFRNESTQSYNLLKNICRGKKVIMLTATPFNNRPSDIFALLKLFMVPKKSKIIYSGNLEQQFKEFGTTFDKLAYIQRYHNSPMREKRSRALAYYKSLFGKEQIDIKDVHNRSHFLAVQIKNIISPIMIRRNRLDLQENPKYIAEVKELSDIAPPLEWFFELTPEQSDFYDRVINKYFADPDDGGYFKGALYRPFIYKEGYKAEDEKIDQEKSFIIERQTNLYSFMRVNLVKRFESSFGAFYKTLQNFIRFAENAQSFIEKTQKYILNRALLEDIYDKDLEEIEDALVKYAEDIKNNKYPENHEIYEIATFANKKQFLQDIESDKELFKKVLKELIELKMVTNVYEDNSSLHDPKALSLIQNIKKDKIIENQNSKNEPKRKIIVFSEYQDTIRYLKPIVEAHFPNKVLTVLGNISNTTLQTIYANFDASLPTNKQKDDYHILLGTDKISEGLNLNRAGMVINYDIPWNPVRVIQRVGRINRISKKVFQQLFIVNFFPTEQGADLVKSREIAQNKMFMIHKAIGEDSKIFDANEEPSPSKLYQKIQSSPDEKEEPSFYTKMIKEFMELKSKYPHIAKQLEKIPPRIKLAKNSNKNELFVIIKKSRLFIAHKNYESGVINLVELEDIISRLKPDPENQTAIPLSEKFWDAYEEIKSYQQTQKIRKPEQSIEQQAINNLRTMQSMKNEYIRDFLPFINTLLEDLLDYGTLSEQTIRQIKDIDTKGPEQAAKALDKLQKFLGKDYLEIEKRKLTNLPHEIIIAIENLTQ